MLIYCENNNNYMEKSVSFDFSLYYRGLSYLKRNTNILIFICPRLSKTGGNVVDVTGNNK